MSVNISTEDFAILLAFESNPFMPMTELASLLRVTRVTAKKRVDDLRNRGIIRTPIAIINPYTLDLHRVSIFAHVNSTSKLHVLEKACDEHPYTHYRVRAFGGCFGLFIQFDIPPNTDYLLHEFLEKLKKENIIDFYTTLKSSGIRTDIYADLKKYNAKLSSWNFSWNSWFDTFSKYKTNLPNQNKKSIDYTNFTPNHFKILRMLTADGSLKQTDIIDKLNLSKTQTHRDYNYVMNNYIDRIRFLYNREIFQLTETYIAFGTNPSRDCAAKLFNAINTDPPPFRFSLDIINNDSILIWVNMSSTQASDFAFSIWNYYESIEVYTLNTKKSKLYWFYPENFNFNFNEWNISKDYFVTEPLERTFS